MAQARTDACYCCTYAALSLVSHGAKFQEVQVLTQNDFFCIIGMKLAEIKLDPIQHLSGFGETQSKTEADILLA